MVHYITVLVVVVLVAAGGDQNNNTLPGSYGGNGKRTEISGPGYTIGTPGPASAGGTGGGPSVL